MAQTKDAAIKIVQAALRSDRDFETYKPQIIQKIKASDDVMIKATVDTVKKYLKDKKKEGFSKLTALMLLKESMDTKNKALVEYVHTKILRRLGLIGQGKDKCLPKDTSAALVQLFSQLLRECIVVWNDWFGYDSRKNPTKYKKTYDAVFAKVEKPTKLVHFTKPEAAEERILPQSINQSEVRSDNGRSPYQNLEASRPGVSDKPQIDEKYEEEEEPPKKKFEIKSQQQQDPFVEKMTALMKHIKGNKEMLYEQMAISEEPDQQGVKMILQNLIKANQQLADNWDELEAKEFPTKDEIADQAVLDNEVIEELVTEYNKMVKKEISMEDYRVFVIKTLSDPTKNPEGLPQSSQVSKGQSVSPAAVQNKSSPVQAQAQAQSQSQSQSQSQQKPQQNDGFDLDAFEEASPELRQQQQAEEQARAARIAQEKAQRERDGPPVRDTGIAGPPDRRAPGGVAGSMGGSQASEGGTRKAPRNFRDLFTNDPKDSRGRKAGTGSRRDKSNLDDSKGSVGFGKSWDVNPQGQGQSQRNRGQQQQNKGQQGGFGVDDFDDLPAADPTGSYDDTSNMSADSRTYDFNYDRSRAVDKSRSRLDPRDQHASAPRFSPSGNVLPPNEDGFNVRGTRKVTASPGYERATAPDIDEALYEAERYDTAYDNRRGNNTNAPAPASRTNLTVDTESANRKYDQRTSNNMNNIQQQQQQQQNNNRPSDGNFGFGNPFGGDDNENNNNNMAQSAGFGGGNQPNLQINGVPQEANINASRRNTPQQQAPVAQQQQQQQRNQPNPQQQQRNQPAPMNQSIPFTQSVMAPTVTGQNARFAPIERPSFLNTIGTNSTINVSTFEGPAMRQADDLLERARRLTSQSRPPSHIDTRPQNMRTSIAGGNYPVPSSLDHQYQPIPPLFAADVRPSLNDPMMRRSSLERVGPYVSSTFNNAAPLGNSAVLNQSGSVGGDGFLREIERAREQSKLIAAKYSSPGSRRQSDSGLISNLAVAAALQGTASSNLASAVLQGPTKYTNGGDSSAVLNTSVRIETEMRQSHYSQYGSKARSPRKEDDSVTFVGGGPERTSVIDTRRGLATERSEKLSRGYGTAKFPEAGEGKEMSKAAQLIEKARRLREESRQRKTFAGEESEKKEYLYQTPSRMNGVSQMKESSYLDNRRDERPMKASQVEVRYVNRMEDGQTGAAPPQTFYPNRYEPSFDNIGNTAVNIRSRDVQISQYASRGRQNETPVRLVGPDGAIYQEVRQGYGIGRKPSEEPRRSAYVANVGRDSPLTTDMVRGRSRETRHETLGQWRHQQQEFGVRESRVDMKRSAYHEAKELLENSRRDVSAHAERRGRFENMSPERLQKTKSPLRERQEKVQEAVELKANETLRIVERPVPGGVGNAGGRTYSRSPAPRGSVTANSLKSSLNVVPPTNAAPIQQGVKATTSSSSQLANEIKSQLNALKQSLVGRREKSDSVSSKATLQLDGSSNSVPQIAQIQRGGERGPIIVQREEVKVQEEGQRKTGVRIDNRDLMGQYSSRVAEKEMKRSAAVPVEMRVEKRESETTPAITPYGTDEGFSRRLNVKEISAVQGVKLTMDDSNVWEEESTLRTRNLDESLRRDREREYRELVGPSYNKPKVGRAVHFDYYLFDQITNAIFANGQGKDVDVFKASCLQNKAILFDSPKLKIDVITRMEDEEGRTGGKKLKVILHYVNKSNESITGFNAEILENSIVQNPRINGNNLPPKYQLKQELYFDFSNFKNQCYTIMITYQHEGFPYSAKVPLPLSVNKFMKLKMVHQGEYKRQWKNLKGGSVKSKYKHINAKFIRDHTEVNKYFDNCLVDVTPTLNPKRKRKYGGVFVLPDGSEHYLRITMDTSRVKFAVASNSNSSQYADWVVQYLSYLLTV